MSIYGITSFIPTLFYDVFTVIKGTLYNNLFENKYFVEQFAEKKENSFKIE